MHQGNRRGKASYFSVEITRKAAIFGPLLSIFLRRRKTSSCLFCIPSKTLLCWNAKTVGVVSQVSPDGKDSCSVSPTHLPILSKHKGAARASLSGDNQQEPDRAQHICIHWDPQSPIWFQPQQYNAFQQHKYVIEILSIERQLWEGLREGPLWSYSRSPLRHQIWV